VIVWYKYVRHTTCHCDSIISVCETCLVSYRYVSCTFTHARYICVCVHMCVYVYYICMYIYMYKQKLNELTSQESFRRHEWVMSHILYNCVTPLILQHKLKCVYTYTCKHVSIYICTYTYVNAQARQIKKWEKEPSRVNESSAHINDESCHASLDK